MHFLKTIILAASAVVAAPATDASESVSMSKRANNICGGGACAIAWETKYCGGDNIYLAHHIVPDCTQTCIKVTDRMIQSVQAFGTGNTGTACYIYSDFDCKDEIGRTGLAYTDQWCVTNHRDLVNNPDETSKAIGSWKCTYGC
ncbi:hypothetical protein FALBO_6742 [Fusarium albosuccineum]|uniref:Uncharacterized protein n=1 Tax=Fusarium albosuccineum TaxID=1237068 RepID=A0A8H4P8J6_9HYPO|nr:hypothetical protein FALBO_6742 [Fusarium albosuccineum]